MAKLRAFIPLLITAVLLIGAAASFGVVSSQSANGEHDTDGDGLIEVSNLEQLNAIRYDLDGDGRPDAASGADAYAAAFPGTPCYRDCEGYELARSLDFDDPASYASGAVNANWTTGVGWLPIGVIEDDPFSAIFDGNGRTISNLYIKRTTEFETPGAIGLFGFSLFDYYLDSHEEPKSIIYNIRNIGLVNVDVTGIYSVGGLVGFNLGAITNSYVTGNVSGVSEVGGLVGSANIIRGSYATGNVSGDDSVGGLVGGIHGRFHGATHDAISGSYATGNVSGNHGVGGLVGSNHQGTIRDSHATGNVSGNSGVGGLVGSNFEGTISGSYATGNVSVNDGVDEWDGNGFGGLVGDGHYATVSGSYATGNVSGNHSVGGLVGDSYGTISGS